MSDWISAEERLPEKRRRWAMSDECSACKRAYWERKAKEYVDKLAERLNLLEEEVALARRFCGDVMLALREMDDE